MQKAAGGPDRVTLFDDLGIYKILATAGDTSAMERFVTEWLGSLIDYDAEHGTPLVLTLSEYLDCGGNYDASARALSVHRSTLKYRLQRIRQVSGHELSRPDVQFNLQVATHAWRTLEARASPDLGDLTVLLGQRNSPGGTMRQAPVFVKADGVPGGEEA